VGKSSLENLGEREVEGIALGDRERESREGFVRRCSQVMGRSGEMGRTLGGLPMVERIPLPFLRDSIRLPLPHAATALRTT
jgi:hypothetical protein